MIGNTVWSNFGDHCLRFGKVVARVMEMRGYDRYDEWMRIDKVSFFKKQGLINTINKL